MTDQETRHLDVPVPSDAWRPFPASATTAPLHAQFEAQVDRRPDALAIAGPGGRATYGQVEGAANAAAARLVAEGASGRPVALAMAHDLDLVVAILAVLKAGSIVLVLDVEAPAPQIQAILDDAAPAVVVVDARGATALVDISGLDRPIGWADLAAGEDRGRPSVEVLPSHPAMLAYSSGTTGAPKAAVLPHDALVHLARGAVDSLRIGPDDRLPMIFPVSMAVAAYPMFLPLVVGGSLHVRDVRSVGLVGFAEWLAEEQISVLYLSPTVARFMGDGSDVELRDLRVVALGGERVDADAVRVVREKFGQHFTMVNGYGTTETGVLTFHVIGADAGPGAYGVPAGLPIPETELRIVADDGAEVVSGATGELIVRSRHLFSGYWNRPDLDGAVLSEEGGIPVYRTGDLGFIDRSGALVLVGRSDTEVKVRGHRVVPGEVEQAMLALPEVVDVVVEARPDQMGTNELVAWVVPAPDHDVASIRAATHQVVRAPLVPGSIVLVDALPLLPNGKLDRRALPSPRRTLQAGLEPVSPSTPTEGRVLGIWQQILDTPELGVHDDLVDLGAQSFDLAWALVQIESRLGVRVPMSAMLDARSVHALAGVIDDLEASGDPPSVTVCVQVGDQDRPRLWMVHDLHGTAYSLRYLAGALGVDQPLWGFESPFLEGRGDIAARLEDLAARYVVALRAEQPAGPYHLAGYSFGGILAFEIASQLVAAGEKVDFLGVVDVGPGYRGRHYNPDRVLDKPWVRVPQPPDPALTWRQRAAWYVELGRRAPVDLAYHVSLRTGLDRWLDPLQFRHDLRHGGVVPPHRRLWYAWRRHWELARRYDWSGRHYPGPLLLLWAEESAASDGSMGWSSVVEGRIDIVRLDVTHVEALLPGGVELVGAALRRGLDDTL